MATVDYPTQRMTGIFSGWRWPAVAAVVAALAVIVTLLVSYLAYDEWPWSTYPSQLNACGRNFQSAGPPQTRAQIFADQRDDIVRIGDVPGWLNHGQLWALSGDEPFSERCRVVMYVRGGPDAFKPYDLVGGP